MLRGLVILLAAAAVAGVFLHARSATAASRDDTAWLQAALDAGGTITLNKLPGGACYQARGLWVSRDGTTIQSNGACITYLGPGPVRLFSPDGDPIASNAVFFVNRSSANAGPPQHVSISTLQVNVPQGTDGFGILVAGSDVTLTKIKTRGFPLDAVTVTGRANGRGYAGPVLIKGGSFLGARRNGISVVGAIGVTIDSNVISAAGNASLLGPAMVSYTGPWAGIDLEPDTVSYPIKAVKIKRNTISDNGGAGILMALATNSGRPQVSDLIEISKNTITRNGASNGPFLRGGICLQGGQANGKGRLSVLENQIVANGGWGLCKHPEGFRMKITLADNTIAQNTDGQSQWG